MLHRFGSLAAQIADAAEARAASPTPPRVSEPARGASAPGRSRGDTGQPFSQERGR